MGRIRGRGNTGTCRRHQKQVAVAIKRGRGMVLLPYVAESQEPPSRSRSRSSDHTGLSNPSRRVRTRRGHLLAMRAPRPRPLCSLVCVYLPREVFFCFFGFAGAVGVFAAPSGFGLLGDTCSSFGFGDSCRCRPTWPQERRQRLERSSRSASA
ncbi:MAG: hypothetical protein ACRDL0_15065 [Thermoleophilaceae bacterium]